MYRILLFAGTTEGRELAEYLSRCNVQTTVCVATEYGQTLIAPQENLQVRSGRLDRQQMEELIQTEGFDLVIDATHPYAQIVTDNIVSACEALEKPYFRCLRQEETVGDYDHILWAKDTQEAAKMLETIEGNILLTTGSKELIEYRAVSGFTERFFPRVLPLANVVESCLALGIPAAHLIAMQGPFSEELNLAMIHQHNISCLVTKESGKAGGFLEKIAAAKRAGIPVLLIGRPQEKGASTDTPEQLRERLCRQYGIEPQAMPGIQPEIHACQEKNGEPKATLPQADMRNPTVDSQPKAARYFPMFVSLEGKAVQVIGGGTISARRIRTLLLFGCQIQVIAPALSEECHRLWESGSIDWVQRCWQPGDCTAQLVLAATDKPEVNRQVVLECRSRQIMVNRCDRQQDCDFYFPAVVEQDGLVYGICSGGADHKKVKHAAAALRKQFREDAAKE